jgi:hypothetical protein
MHPSQNVDFSSDAAAGLGIVSLRGSTNAVGNPKTKPWRRIEPLVVEGVKHVELEGIPAAADRLLDRSVV